jgi:protein TonB
MSEGGFLQQRPKSPTSLVVVIAAHAAAISALALSKMEIPVKVFTPIKIRNIEDPPPPDPEPQPKEQVKERVKSVVDAPPAPIPLPRPDDVILVPERPLGPIDYDPGPPGQGEVAQPEPPKPVPVPKSVRLDAQIDPRSDLQPDYPAAEERAQVEGSVTVRVLIGTDGRVKAVEKVRAASDAFFRATERQALRHWRFRPATVDGRPVESRKVMIVHFRLDA